MMVQDDERVTVIERVTFLPDGGSHHVWTFPDGTTEERTFAISPLMFIKGPPFGLETAVERGIKTIVRKA